MTYRTYHNETTRSSVLRAVADTDNAAAWERFFDLYAGFVFAFARSKGLSADDADDQALRLQYDPLFTQPVFEGLLSDC